MIAPFESHAVEFSQETRGAQGAGYTQAKRNLDPNQFPDLWTCRFSLGGGRDLEIRTNLASARQDQLQKLAAVVRAQYAYLAQETGRQVPGGVLLYLLEFPDPPRWYRFSVELPDPSPWNEVRVALLSQDRPLTGPGASAHLTRFLFDTLPHELTHSLLVTEPTIRHDHEGGGSQGTRWFIEGACEMLAKGFRDHFLAEQGQSLPPCLASGSGWIPVRLRQEIWTWGQDDSRKLSTEVGFYHLAQNLVESWCRRVDLKSLLEIMSARGGDHDGDGLEVILRETTGWDPALLLFHATGAEANTTLASSQP